MKIDKGFLLIGVIVIFTLCFICLTSAELFQFDNVKSYDLQTQTITITNTFGLGKTIADIKLNTPADNIVDVSPFEKIKVAEFEINNYEDYTSIMDSMKFYNIKDNMKEINVNYDFRVKVNKSYEYNIYGKGCNEAIKNGTCVPPVEKVEIRYKEEWENSNLKTEFSLLKGDKITIGIFTTTSIGDYVEWIPTLYGKELIEWASYSATGGSITTSGAYTIHTFTSNGTFEWMGATTNIEILVVGGGGGGGKRYGSGGGAGGIINNSMYSISAGSYNVIIGNGGLGASVTNLGYNGTNTTFGTQIAWGGGGGGGNFAAGGGSFRGYNGGSGGGAGGEDIARTGGTGVVGQGRDGADMVAYGNNGGGGASSKGSSGTYDGGTGLGGIGFILSTSGTAHMYSYGGNGSNIQNGINGSVNTGNGGSGGDGSTTGGMGGSGIVIIKYLTPLITPSVTLNSPIDYYNTTNPSITFNATAIDEQAITNVTLYIDGVLNQTDSSGTNGTYLFNKILSDGLHNWSILAYNNNSQSNQSATRFLTIDTTSPSVNITNPLSQTYTDNYTTTNNNTIFFNSSESDAHLSNCWYSNDYGITNNSLTCNANLTLYLPYGSYNYTVWANDTFGFLGSDSVSFILNYKLFENTTNSINWTTPTIENTNNIYTFTFNKSSSLTISSVIFLYNNVSYSSTFSAAADYQTITQSFITPMVAVDTNYIFYWSVLFSDGTRVNSSFNTQQVNNIFFGDCSSYPNKLFNFTLVDEKTQSTISGTIETNIQIKTSDGLITLYNWTSSTSGSNITLCSNVNLTTSSYFKVDGTIKYYSITENYSASVEYYNYLNYTLNNITRELNTTLYDLNITEATEFQLTFKDSSFRTRENILIYVYRQYLPSGDFKVVELPKTDSNGQVVVHLVRNDVIYNFLAVDSEGNILGSLNNVIAFCQDYTIGDCVINFQGTTAETGLEDFLSEVGISYSLSYSNTTNLISLTFLSSNTTAKNVRMEVISSAIVTNRTLCDSSLNAITGTLTCDVSSVVNTTSSVFVKIYVNGVQQIQDSLSFDSSSHNTTGLIFLGFLFVLMVGIFFIESKEGVIIGVILSFIVLVTLGIVKGSIIGIKNGVYASVLWLIIVGIILLVKLNGEKQ